jgi:hypothetical protein
MRAALVTALLLGCSGTEGVSAEPARDASEIDSTSTDGASDFGLEADAEAADSVPALDSIAADTDVSMADSSPPDTSAPEACVPKTCPAPPLMSTCKPLDDGCGGHVDCAPCTTSSKPLCVVIDDTPTSSRTVCACSNLMTACMTASGKAGHVFQCSGSAATVHPVDADCRSLSTSGLPTWCCP